jgi:hypothetical protein
MLAPPNTTLNIYLDNQGTVKKGNTLLNNPTSSRKLMRSQHSLTWTFLSHIKTSKNLTIKLHWVRGHNNNANNDMADIFATQALSLPPMPHPIIFHDINKATPYYNNIPIDGDARKFTKTICDNRTKIALLLHCNTKISDPPHTNQLHLIDTTTITKLFKHNKIPGRNSTKTFMLKNLANQLPTGDFITNRVKNSTRNPNCIFCDNISDTNNHLTTCTRTQTYLPTIQTPLIAYIKKLLEKHAVQHHPLLPIRICNQLTNSDNLRPIISGIITKTHTQLFDIDTSSYIKKDILIRVLSKLITLFYLLIWKPRCATIATHYADKDEDTNLTTSPNHSTPPPPSQTNTNPEIAASQTENTHTLPDKHQKECPQCHRKYASKPYYCNPTLPCRRSYHATADAYTLNKYHGIRTRLIIPPDPGLQTEESETETQPQVLSAC